MFIIIILNSVKSAIMVAVECFTSMDIFLIKIT